MTPSRLNGQSCETALSKVDSYIDRELLTETTLDLVDHFRRCAACSAEAEARQAVRARLQAAVQETATPAGLEARVRERLREARTPSSRRLHFMALAAAVVVCFGWWLTHERAAAPGGPLADILRVGLGDHVHCAVIRQAKRRVGFVEGLPAAYRPLLPIVRERAPADLPLFVAHECASAGRRFIHLTFRNDRNLVSLVIARKQDGESLALLAPALSRSGIPVYAAAERPYQVAAFETRDYLVYTISDLPARRNLELMASLAPATRALLD